jgi:Tfp pilus assembly protein FimT
MIEMIFVILIIGILATIIIPRLSNDLEKEKNKILNAIRYTQHLALIDDKFDTYNKFWRNERWCIKFFNNSYSIFSKKYANDGTFVIKYALDPNIKTMLYNVKLGVEISNKIICFDELGRPYNNTGELKNIAKKPIYLQLSQYDKNTSIRIENETGFTH